MPPKAQVVLARPSRYKVLEGGRGSAKSWSFADALIWGAYERKLRILCTRETQNSIRDSVHRLLSDRIHTMGLAESFNIQKESIVCPETGSEFFFKGLRHNISEIKSMEGVDICWVEEAEKVSEDSWNILIPTIRKDGSEIWISFNPEDENSPTYKRFVKNPPPDCRSAHMTFEDNAMFPEVLRREMEYDKATDPEKYQHVWMGLPKKYAQSLIFKGKIIIDDFPPRLDDEQLYFGLDFGFSSDAFCLNRMFIREHRLYIDYEAYGHGIEIEDMPEFMRTVPDVKSWEIIADSARPDTISYLKNQGFNIIGAEKGAGSVEDGIEFLRSFEAIIIHPRCTGTKDNYENYRWKTDKVTGEILPIPLDKSNHAPDADRYALEKYIKRKKSIFQVL